MTKISHSSRAIALVRGSFPKNKRHLGESDRFLLIKASGAKLREPSFFQKAYYKIATALHNLRASACCPGLFYFTPKSDVPFPDGVQSNGCSLHISMQPRDWLAKEICQEAQDAKKTLYIVSVLEPFEADQTSELLPKAHLIIAQDNEPMPVYAIEQGVRAIEHGISLGNQYIDVHCKSGKGRSATVLAAYLVRHANMTPEDAAKYLKTYRKETCLVDSGNTYHLEALKKWAQLHHAKLQPGSV